jgi:hypothetical protein
MAHRSISESLQLLVWLRAHHGSHFTLSRIVQKGGLSQCTIPISATIKLRDKNY